MTRRGPARDDDEDGVTSVTISGPGEVGVTLIPIGVADRPLCAIASDLLTKACTRADKACLMIGLVPDVVARRAEESNELQRRFSATGSTVEKAMLDLGVPARLLPALKAGLKIEIHNTERLLKKQTELRLETEETEARQSQLSRLLERLDVAGLGAEAAE
jgi:hypothetical protein